MYVYEILEATQGKLKSGDRNAGGCEQFGCRSGLPVSEK